MLLVAAIVGLASAFVHIPEAILTLVLALFFALVLEPVVRGMQRKLPLGRGACATTLVLGLVALYQQLENDVLQPTILGKAANVSGFFVIVSVMIFGALLGVIGALIAVPIIASIQIIVIELTEGRRAAMAALREPDDSPVASG